MSKCFHNDTNTLFAFLPLLFSKVHTGVFQRLHDMEDAFTVSLGILKFKFFVLISNIASH